MIVDRIAILDWSAANQPRLGKDSIWLGVNGQPPENLPTRAAALARLQALVAETLAAGQRLLIGADFAFGYPAGFARALTGQAGALSVWDWLDARITDDDRNRSNRFAVAARANAALPGLGPFWFNPTREELPDLPHKGTARHGHGWPEHRLCDAQAKGAQSVWKLGGAGAVGSQSLTGLPRLNQLRHRFRGAVAVWPFEAPTTPIVLAEVFPSLLAPRVAAATGMVRDAAQVTLLSRALAAQPELAPLLTHPDHPAIADEGWILGLGHEAALLSSLL
jgi:hypothetical protein